MAKEMVTGVMDEVAPMDLKVFGESLAAQRKACGYDTDQFSKLLGIESQQLERIEAGAAEFSEFSDKLTRIAVALQTQKV
jgi:transcriptional regulator with XRE-family HTH domain